MEKMGLELEQLIIHHLLLKANLGKDIGLCHGKMGLILFFAHYYKHTGLLVYEDTADELMDELKKEIHKELPIGFASGVSGIGWGIEYMIQNRFVNDDSLKVCNAMDKKIMEKDPRRISDYSLDTGLEGILHYVLAHIKGVKSQHNVLPFDKTYLFDLYQAVSIVPQNVELSENFKLLSSKYSSFYTGGELDYSLHLSFIPEDLEIEKKKLNMYPLGLKNGLSGYLLKKQILNSL